MNVSGDAGDVGTDDADSKIIRHSTAMDETSGASLEEDALKNILSVNNKEDLRDNCSDNLIKNDESDAVVPRRIRRNLFSLTNSAAVNRFRLTFNESEDPGLPISLEQTQDATSTSPTFQSPVKNKPDFYNKPQPDPSSEDRVLHRPEILVTKSSLDSEFNLEVDGACSSEIDNKKCHSLKETTYFPLFNTDNNSVDPSCAFTTRTEQHYHDPYSKSEPPSSIEQDNRTKSFSKSRKFRKAGDQPLFSNHEPSSQQDFTSPVSTPMDRDNERMYPMTSVFSQHQNNNDYISESCFMGNHNTHKCTAESCFIDNPNSKCISDCCFSGNPVSKYTAGYHQILQEDTFYHSDNPEGIPNGWVLSDLNMDSYPLLPHHEPLAAPPIHEMYQNHVFFSHCPADKEWVEHMVAHLEAPPFNYTCSYSSLQDQTDESTLQQRILYAAMLSERVVLVISSRYFEDTWPSFEKTLKKLTQLCLHNQRIMAVILEDCEIPESLGELYFLDASDPDFFHVFTKRLQTSMTNGTILTFCRLQVKVGWNSFLVPADESDLDIPPSLFANGIGMEKTEYEEIITKVSGVIKTSNKLPWLLSAQPLTVLLLAAGLWLPAFIAILVIHVDDDSGIALPVRLTVFLFPLGLVGGGFFIKWRRSYWLTKIVRLLVQNCVDVNQAFYFQGRPLFVTACHVQANVFAIYFVYFDATECVRNVDLLLFTCMENDWDKLLKLIKFYTRNENYLSRMSIAERLTVMISAPYLVKLVKQALPQPPQQRHVAGVLCLCQFTEECISRFAHGLDREDVPGLAQLFTRHLPGKVSGSAVRRVQEELFHANHGLVP